MAVNKVVILPCMGIGQPISGITRLAAYIVNEDLLPEQTLLECIPALLRGVKEDVDMIEEFPSIVIDGCPDKCASGVCCTIGIKPAARIYAVDVIRSTGIKPGNSRQEISETGKELALKIAKSVAHVANNMLNSSSYQYERQTSLKENRKLCDYSVDPDKELEYIKINSCWSIPRSMPELPLINL